MITKLELKLDEAFRKQYKLQTWGYYVKEKPSNTDVFFQIHSYIYDIDFKPLNLFNRKIDEFVISNRTPMPGQRVIIYISDELSDFDNLTDSPMIISDIDYPTGSIAAVEDAVNVANTAITSRQDISNSHLSDIKTYVDGLEGILNGINSKDFSTETTLAQVKSNLDDIKLYIDTLETTLNSLNSKDFATQSTLASLNSKDFSTETTLAQVKTNLDDIKLYIDTLETTLNSLNSKDFATQTTLNQLKIDIQTIKNRPSILFNTFQEFTAVNTTADFTLTLTNHAVFDKNDYSRIAIAFDSANVTYTCIDYTPSTKVIKFAGDAVNGSTSTTVTVFFMKVVQ